VVTKNTSPEERHVFSIARFAGAGGSGDSSNQAEADAVGDQASRMRFS
jgi:hypothetical protein